MHTEAEDFSNNLCGFGVNNPSALILGVFNISVGRVRTQRFTRLSFCLKYGAYLFARILGVPLVDDIEEGGKIAVLLIGTIHSVVYGNEADIHTGKEYFGVVTDLEVVSAESAHILYDDRSDLAVFRKGDKALPIGAVKVRSAVSVIYEYHCVAEPIVICVFLQNGSLVDDTVAVSLKFVITGEAAI